MTCREDIYHIQKDSGSLDDQNPPKKMNDFYNFSLVREASDPIRALSALPYNILVFHFFGQNEIILWGN